MFYYNSSCVTSLIKYILSGVASTVIFYQFFAKSWYTDIDFQWCPNNESKMTLNETKEKEKCVCKEEIKFDDPANEEKINEEPDGWIFDSRLPQNDPNLVEFAIERFLDPPSPRPYNLTSRWEDLTAKDKQHIYVMKILKGMKHGFFIECGANNGELRSRTLVLERDHGWTGLLMEGDPYVYDSLLDKNRKAWSSPTCLSTMPYPQRVASVHASDDVSSGLSSDQIPSIYKSSIDGNAKLVNVTYLPLFTLLAALDVKTVDYFALDVKGSELKVLKTIPFKEVRIKILTIEYPGIPEGKDALMNFMQSRGYVMAKMMEESTIQNIMFVHKSLKDNISTEYLTLLTSNKTSM